MKAKKVNSIKSEDDNVDFSSCITLTNKYKSKSKSDTGEHNKEVKLPFGDRFSEAWDEWIEYRRVQHGLKYRSIIAERSLIDRITQLANSEDEAIGIISQSILNGWRAFWPLKTSSFNCRTQDDCNIESFIDAVKYCEKQGLLSLSVEYSVETNSTLHYIKQERV